MYLVVGANGFLGSYVLKNILEKTDDTIVAIARNVDNVLVSPRISWVSCDITQKTDVDRLCDSLESTHNKKIVYLAAYHNPDLVEKNPQYAWHVNVTSLSYFINKVSDVKCLFYPSTDSVYGNSIDGYKYRENDKLNPVNTYGKQKCAAESVVLWYGYNTVRFPFLIAPSLSPAKKHFYDELSDSLINGNEIRMLMDSYRSSLNFDTAAALLIDLMEMYSQRTPKTINICGDDSLSKYDIGLILADKLHVDRSLVRPISVNGDEHIFKTSRAQTTLMDNSLLKKTLGLKEIKFSL